MLPKSALLAISVVTICPLTLATCGYRDGISRNLRRVTYPSDFNYVTNEQISPPMLKMGRELHALNELLRGRNDASDPEALRAQALQHLGAIDVAARALENQARGESNHPGLESNLARLRSDVLSAEQEIKQDPPRYFLAGSVSGACLYCHGHPEHQSAPTRPSGSPSHDIPLAHDSEDGF